MKIVFLISCLIMDCYGQLRRFPDDFMMGTATAAYQIEGAWDADGKGVSIWDHLTHTRPEVIRDRSNGDVAANSYYNYVRDVEMIRELGLDVYRFSLSWPRILPTGFVDKINEAAIDFYNNYINEMMRYNITPIVTLYHLDLPQKLQDLGGFTNPLFAGWYEDFARVAYKQFGDRVKLWITFNEPREICNRGYGANQLAPMLNAHGIGDYLCAKHLLLAHARAYHLYNSNFKTTQQGECGITFSVNWNAPLTDSEDDAKATELNKQASWAIYTDPIFSETGGFPRELSDRVAAKSAEQGYSRSRLPNFTEDEVEFIRGSSDFLGVNHYTGSYISASENLLQDPVPSLSDDISVGSYVPPEWLPSATFWLRQAPDSLYHTLVDLNDRYPNNTVFYITENGWSTHPEAGLRDDDRVRYFRAALENVLDILEAGINLKGYMAWSLMDNFEWAEGYTESFGLYQVDFNSPERTRTAKKSAYVYKHVLENRYIDYDYDPEVMELESGTGFATRGCF